MFKQSIHLAILLLCAWNIYFHCQREIALPLIAGGILLGSFLLRSISMDKKFHFFKQMTPLFIVILSLMLGYALRSAVPLPEDAISPFPKLMAAAQSASIIAALLIWLKPLTPHNFHTLLFLAWTTVALSINTPYSPLLLFYISLFFLLSVIMIILHTSRQPIHRKYILTYYRDFALFSVILIAITIILFLGISRSIAFLDNAYSNTINDYFLPRDYSHFLNFSSRLSLTNPGTSAFDNRPVLEATVPGVRGVYLKTQVFRDYHNGSWKEIPEAERTFVPSTPHPGDKRITLTMFVPLARIIPSPYRVSAIQGPGLYEKDINQIIYANETRPLRVVNFFTRKERTPVQLDESTLLAYKKIPDDIAQKLKDISSEIIGDAQSDVSRKIRRLRNFFQREFKYSLNTDTKADHKGLIEMIEQRKPAYCTYFATALCLLLRAQGLPSRVVTGFYTTEIIDPKKNTFLARVRNAHAWVQVLMKSTDSSGKNILVWANVDPTPAGDISSISGGTMGSALEAQAEKFGLAILRSIASLQNSNKERLRLYLLYTLLSLIFLTGTTKIIRSLKPVVRQPRKATPSIKPPEKLRLIYRKYEQHLLKTFGETRKTTETDQEVVARLKHKPELPKEAVTQVVKFLEHYHAARFGNRTTDRLEDILK